MATQQDQAIVWLNGKYLPWHEASVHIMTFTLHYGYGIFEGVRAYETPRGPAIFRLKDHTDRLFRSAHIMNMPMPYSKEELSIVQQTLIKKNNLRSAYLRPMCYYGMGLSGLHTKNLETQVMVVAREWGAYLGAENMQRGIRIKTSSYTRNHATSTLNKSKTNGNYVNSILALQEAQACGFDEALMLDHQGYVAEGSGENFFMIRNGKIYTPDTSSALEGITRDTIFTIAKDLGFSVEERRLTRDDVYIADEAFFTGTAAEVTPIRELDGRQIGDGTRGPITTLIQERFFDQVGGKCEEHDDWLFYVK